MDLAVFDENAEVPRPAKGGAARPVFGAAAGPLAAAAAAALPAGPRRALGNISNAVPKPGASGAAAATAAGCTQTGAPDGSCAVGFAPPLSARTASFITPAVLALAAGYAVGGVEALAGASAAQQRADEDAQLHREANDTARLFAHGRALGGCADSVRTLAAAQTASLYSR